MRRARSTLAWTSLAVAIAVASPAASQERPTLSGSWSASGLAERWSIGDWGEACGPKPAPQGAPGGAVQISERGSELSIVGAGRAFSTAECWEQMPGLARTSHSASGGGRFWRTRCASGPNDPRQATVTTTIQATDTSISLTETGQYQFVIQETNCTASVTRARTFTLVRREGDAPAAASASAAATTTPPASSATPPAPPAATAKLAAPEPRAARCAGGGSGDPARLEVRPSRKLLRPGDRFAFRAAVLDEGGCPLSTRPTWTIAGGALAAKATIDGSGAITIAADAPEGRLEAVASVGGKGVSIPIEIASAEHYAALLATSGLDDAGEADAPAVALIATGTIGGSAGVADDLARGRKQTFVAIVGGLAILLGMAGLALLRRGRAATRRAPTRELAEDDEAEASSPEPSPAPPAPAPAPTPVPERAARPTRAEAARPRGKICPTCGARYPSEAGFCGKDGTVLVLIN